MAADGNPWFADWEPDASTSNELKQEKQLSASQRRYYSFCRRKVSDNQHWIILSRDTAGPHYPMGACTVIIMLKSFRNTGTLDSTLYMTEL